MRYKSQGFTLIELIVVIIILGILAATALPRFTNLQAQARQAKLQAAVGALRAAASLYHASCLAQAQNAATPCGADSAGTASTVTMEGTAVTGINQYPTANAAGVVVAAGINTAGTNPDYNVVGGGAGLAGVINVDVPGPTAGTCRVSYTAADWAGTSVVAPVVTVVDNTCV